MPLFQSRPKVIDAVQFVDEANLPRGVVATRLDHKFLVRTIQGTLVDVHVGEWIVDEGDGIHFYPIDDKTFKGPKGYQPLEG